MTLKELLKTQEEKGELDSLRERSDSDWEVKLSRFVGLKQKVELLIDVLDDIYEVEEKGEEVFLKVK